LNPYKVDFFHRSKDGDKNLIRRDYYRFKTRFNRVYFIEVEVYKKSLFFVKFFCRIHKNLDTKYQIVLNDGDAFRILSTCISLASILLKEDSKASFGFIGINDLGKNRNNTRRYKIYKTLAQRYFSPESFNHVKNIEYSIYLLLSKKNVNLSAEEIQNEISVNYDFDNNMS
jgi:hypothetical protein